MKPNNSNGPLLAVFLAVLASLAADLPAQAPPRGFTPGEVHTRITTSLVQKYKIIVAPLPVVDIGLADSAQAAEKLRGIVLDDLDYSLRFDLINRMRDELSFMGLVSAKDRVNYPGWQATGADYLVAGSFFILDRKPTLEIRVYDLSLKDLVYLRNYAFDTSILRSVAHRISDDIVFNVTGERGIAGTRIVFSSTVSKGVRELFLVDYDGYNLQRLTKDNSVNFLPTWSTDGTSIAYTSMKGPDSDLYLLDLNKQDDRPLFVAKGVDMAPNWCARNRFLAFSSGVTGNQEIYYLVPGEAKPRRLTFSNATDSEPCWSPNGDEIAFMSTRAGNPHIFVMGADGLNVRRLTFESRNYSPQWRPMPYGDKIVMVTEIQGVFQIAIIDINGYNFMQLTTQAENRDPSWSPDGLHIVFASNRRGGPGNYELYTMDWDGRSQRPLSAGSISGRGAAWSPFLDH